MSSKSETKPAREELIPSDLPKDKLKLAIQAQVKKHAERVKQSIKLVDGQMRKMDYLQVQALVEIMCKANREFHLESQQERVKHLEDPVEYLRATNDFFSRELENVTESMSKVLALVNVKEAVYSEASMVHEEGQDCLLNALRITM